MKTNHQRIKDNKRKGMRISIAFHSLILVLGIIPFLVEAPDTQEYAQAIMIELSTETGSSSGGSSAARASSRPARKQVSMASLSKVSSSKSLDVPHTKPVITAPNPDLNMPEDETFFDDPLEVTETNETDEVVEVVEDKAETNHFEGWEVADSEELSDAPSPMSGEGEGEEGGKSLFRNISDFDGDFGDQLNGDAESGDDPFADGFFDGEWPGETDGTEGKNIGAGKVGDGKFWGDFAGDGLFNRKVIQRADVARLAIKEGKLVVNLCIDQSGNVVYVKCDATKSTISDSKIVALAESVAEDYVFEEDASASSQQCGKLTFVFKIDE